jgi:hypothetical protein
MAVRLTDGSAFFKPTTPSDTQPISASSLPLPTGAATETTLALIKNTDGIKKIVDALPTGTNTIGKVDQGAAGATAWKTDGSGVTQPISATSLPLPTGAATETTLALIKNTDGVKKIVDALPTGDNRIGRLKITDDTNVLGVDAQNHAYVAGKSAAGVAPSSNPISVSGVDGGGLKRALLTDNTGKLLVTATSTGNSQVEGRAADGTTPVGNPVLIAGQDGINVQSIKTDTLGRLEVVPATRPTQLPLLIDLFYRATEGTIVAAQFKRVLTYTVPTGYSAYLVQFSSWQNETSYSRLVIEASLGTLNVTTNVFTDGSAYTSPQFAGTVEAEVTTQFGAANIITVTVTYVNQSGVAGRTGTFTIPKSSIVGTRVILVLQAGDTGVRDITAMSAAPSGGAGALKVLGFITLTWHSNLATTTGLLTQYYPGAIAFPEGTVVGIEYSGGTVAKERVFDVNIQLVQ